MLENVGNCWKLLDIPRFDFRTRKCLLGGQICNFRSKMSARQFYNFDYSLTGVGCIGGALCPSLSATGILGRWSLSEPSVKLVSRFRKFSGRLQRSEQRREAIRKEKSDHPDMERPRQRKTLMCHGTTRHQSIGSIIPLHA